MKNRRPSNSASDYDNGQELSRRDLLRGGAALLGARGKNIVGVYAESVKREPLIPAGAPLNYVPTLRQSG